MAVKQKNVPLRRRPGGVSSFLPESFRRIGMDVFHGTILAFFRGEALMPNMPC
jgi:hypothetical protein